MFKYTILPAAAAAAFLVLGSGAAQANECGLNSSQLANGWTCTFESSPGATVPSYEQAGNSHMCKYFESTSTTEQWVARNPSGGAVDEKSTDPVVVPGDPVKVGGNVVCPE